MCIWRPICLLHGVHSVSTIFSVQDKLENAWRCTPQIGISTSQFKTNRNVHIQLEILVIYLDLYIGLASGSLSRSDQDGGCRGTQHDLILTTLFYHYPITPLTFAEPTKQKTALTTFDKGIFYIY